MSNFVLESCKECPRCKGELESAIDADEIPVKKCKECGKEYYIAIMIE